MTLLIFSFYPTALKGCRGIVFTNGVWMGGRKSLCRCKTSWCDLDLTFDLAVVTLSLKIVAVVTFTYNALSRLYLRNHKL